MHWPRMSLHRKRQQMEASLSHPLTRFVSAAACSASEFWMLPCKPGLPGRLTSQGQPFQTCVNACRQDINCKGFDWLPASKYCWLINKPSKEKPLKVTLQRIKQVCNSCLGSPNEHPICTSGSAWKGTGILGS